MEISGLLRLSQKVQIVTRFEGQLYARVHILDWNGLCSPSNAAHSTIDVLVAQPFNDSLQRHLQRENDPPQTLGQFKDFNFDTCPQSSSCVYTTELKTKTHTKHNPPNWGDIPLFNSTNRSLLHKNPTHSLRTTKPRPRAWSKGFRYGVYVHVSWYRQFT